MSLAMRALEGSHIKYLVMKYQGLSFARAQRAVLWVRLLDCEHRAVLAFLGAGSCWDEALDSSTWLLCSSFWLFLSQHTE